MIFNYKCPNFRYATLTFRR